MLIRLKEWLAAHRAISFSLAVTLAMRVWLAIWGAVVIIQNGSPITPNPPTMYHGIARVSDQGLGILLAPWQRWDAIWYLRIAQFGYSSDDLSTSFFPLFSILTRATASVTQDYIIAALVVSTVAMFGAFGLLYRIASELTDEASSQRAVLYWALFPTSFYFFAPYGESVLAVSALAALFFVRKRNWAFASIAAAGATLTRPIGFLIVIPMAIEAWHAHKPLRAQALLPLVSVVPAMGAWMLYLQVQFGDALLWVHAEESWQRIFVLPGQTLLWTIQNIMMGQEAIANNIVDLTLTLLVLGGCLAGWKKMPFSFSLYALVMILIPLLSYAQASGYALAPMAAAGRRAIVVVPAFIALGALWKGKWKEPLWIGVSATVQVILFAMFVKWLWID